MADNKCFICKRKVPSTQMNKINGINVCARCFKSGAFSNYVDKNTDKNTDKDTEEETENKISIPTQIKGWLDEHIIGQEQAKKALSIAVYNHIVRTKYNSSRRNKDKLSKSNILIIGGTGTGKTLMARTLAKIINKGIVIENATSLTSAGYIGRDIEDILRNLIQSCNNDIKLAENGVVFIDEIDKIRKSKTNTKDVSGLLVQQGLLKIVEGGEISLNTNLPEFGTFSSIDTINTDNILFICGGAFDGLDKIITSRTGSVDGNPLKYLIPDDLIKFGMIPEFIGRLTSIVVLDDLEVSDYKKIITEPKNSLLEQYQKLFKQSGITLKFTDEALCVIAEVAYNRSLGARGLKTILEDVLQDYMYELPGSDTKTITINDEYVKEKLS